MGPLAFFAEKGCHKMIEFVFSNQFIVLKDEVLYVDVSCFNFLKTVSINVLGMVFGDGGRLGSFEEDQHSIALEIICLSRRRLDYFFRYKTEATDFFGDSGVFVQQLACV